MAVPRPLLLALLGLLLVSATFMATRAHRTSDSKSSSQPAASPAHTSKPAAKAEAHASKPAPKKATAHSDRATARHARRAASPLAKPAAVARAIGKGRVVVLAFLQTGGDDRADAVAVASLRHRHLAAVFTDSIDHIGRYGAVVGGLGIQQAPAIVIVDSHRRARLVEGYVDPESLAQEVADSRG